ncbi:MAG: hypothetical protein JWN39_1860 [Ilumatobacteraceae bacterium]|nr:hypothetical protein [Ilumatobacteraceae bacterium]
MDTLTYTLVPIDPQTADALRAGGGVPYTADSVPGYPCRQCLRDAAIGEEVLLVAHDPFTMDSPYRSSSPIFIHRDPCTPDAGAGVLPEQLTCRKLSVRSFDPEAMMIDASLIDGSDLDATIRRFFDEPTSARIHVHNAVRGCWAVTVERP